MVPVTDMAENNKDIGQYDFIIVGGGVMAMSTARAVIDEWPDQA